MQSRTLAILRPREALLHPLRQALEHRGALLWGRWRFGVNPAFPRVAHRQTPATSDASVLPRRTNARIRCDRNPVAHRPLRRAISPHAGADRLARHQSDRRRPCASLRSAYRETLQLRDWRHENSRSSLPPHWIARDAQSHGSWLRAYRSAVRDTRIIANKKKPTAAPDAQGDDRSRQLSSWGAPRTSTMAPRPRICNGRFGKTLSAVLPWIFERLADIAQLRQRPARLTRRTSITFARRA